MGKPRKKVVPKHKQYVTPNKDLDVLSGRGGRSNHWPGNKRYREEIENRKAWYKLVDKDDKTKLAQDLVDYIKTYKGRFLQLDMWVGTSSPTLWLVARSLKPCAKTATRKSEPRSELVI